MSYCKGQYKLGHLGADYSNVYVNNISWTLEPKAPWLDIVYKTCNYVTCHTLNHNWYSEWRVTLSNDYTVKGGIFCCVYLIFCLHMHILPINGWFNLHKQLFYSFELNLLL